MYDLDEFGQEMEAALGIGSNFCLFMLHEFSIKYGSKWDFDKPETMEIIVNKENAEIIYGYCREISKGYNVGIGRGAAKKIKAARREAHKYLFDEANNPATTVERKIHLVKLTGKGTL